MKNLDHILNQNKGKFPEEILPKGHEDRFRKELYKPEIKKPRFLSHFTKIAASLFLICSIAGIWYFSTTNDSVEQYSVDEFKPNNLSEKELETSTTIAQEKEDLFSLTTKQNPILNTSLVELKKLEKSYKQLEKDLMQSGNDKVIEAMHKNLELRVKILKNTKTNINKYKTNDTP